MFRILVGFLFVGSILILILSGNKKDYENCVKLHGEKFAQNRKKILLIGGSTLFTITGLVALIDILG
jgi:hypothetical protein